MLSPNRILVIRLSAFGDVVRSFATFAAIRRQHPSAHITWLTTAPFAALTDGSGYFDAVWPIQRWKWWQLGKWAAFMRQMRAGEFDIVYDMQRNDRSRFLRRLAPLALQTRWYGEAAVPEGVLDTHDISIFPPPAVEWMGGDATRFNVPSPYVLLVPGSAPQHPFKRWPVSHYIALAKHMADVGITPVAIGADAEREAIAHIKASVPSLIDLTAKTTLGDIAALARGAVGTVGNDTGPMHVIALTGCPIVSLFSGHTDPAKCAPQGSNTTVLREQNIANISVEKVWEAFGARKR